MSSAIEKLCDNCKNIVKQSKEIKKLINEKEYCFCSDKCADSFKGKLRWKEHRGLWEKYVEEGRKTSGAKFFFILLIALIFLGAILIVALAYTIKPVTQSQLVVDDIIFVGATPTGNNITTMLETKAEIVNKGTGDSGDVKIWFYAVNYSTELIESETTVSELKDIDGNMVDKIQSRKTVFTASSLELKPGKYKLRIKVYENDVRVWEGYKGLTLGNETVTPISEKPMEEYKKEEKPPQACTFVFESAFFLVAIAIIVSSRRKLT
ncbi:MAG: hypothetical protein AB1779_06180 [Candidatus Thermoplasmatota archaeon]